jgi:uncharacterized protein (DUF58 family)
MLVAAINYQLSLGYALTFLLGGIAIVAILHTFRNLTQVVLRPGRCEPVFAGQLAEFSLTIVNPTRIERFALRLIAPVWTRYPVGLWRAWGYWHPAMRVLVYPTPETPPVPLPETLARSSEGEGSGQGEEDVAALRPYRPGDPLRRIAWKAIARSGSDTLLSKDFDGGARGERLLDWHALPTHLDVEARISRLARWVIDAEASGGKWSLQLPGEQIEPDGGPGHRQRCLEALALMDV